MKRLLLFLSIFYIHTCALFAQTVEWSSSFDRYGFSADRKFIQTDAGGNVYTNRIVYTDSLGYFMAKFDFSGQLQWQSPYSAVMDKMSTDFAGNSYSIGRFYHTALIGGVVLTDTVNHMVGFYAKHDSNGNCLWARTLGEKAYLGDIYSLPSGEFYLGGYATTQPLYLANDTIPADHGFIGKVDSAGNFIWAKVIGTMGLKILEVDIAGNFYISGSVYGTMTVGEGPGMIYISSNSWENAFLAKFDSNMNVQWAKVGKTYGVYDPVSGLGLDSLGNAFVAGTFGQYMEFDGHIVSTNGNNMYLVKFDPLGNYQWMKYSYGISPGITLTDCFTLTVDIAGNSFVTGKIGDDTIHFDSYILNGQFKPYLIKYDIDGNLLWALDSEIQPSGIAGDATGLCLDSTGKIYVAGCYSGSAYQSYLTKISESSIITEIQQGENASDLIIYPNPTCGNFFVNYSSAEITTLELTVLNALGQKVYSEKIPRFQGEFKKEISTSNFSKGIYTVQIRSGKNLKFKKVVVI